MHKMTPNMPCIRTYSSTRVYRYPTLVCLSLCTRCCIMLTTGGRAISACPLHHETSPNLYSSDYNANEKTRAPKNSIINTSTHRLQFTSRYSYAYGAEERGGGEEGVVVVPHASSVAEPASTRSEGGQEGG